MILTNRYGLPAAIVEAIRRDPYDAGAADISCTRLIGPPMIRYLEALHADELEEDASDRVWSLLGQGAHAIAQRAQTAGELSEERLFADCGGWRISGAFDLYDGETLSDIKVTSVWSVKGGPKPEWTAQLNVLSWLLRQNGWPVRFAHIVAVLRDWRKNERLRYGGDYPAAQVAALSVPLWGEEMAAAYVAERVALHRQNPPPPCTPEERWDRPTTYAVMKSGRKTAIKLHSSSDAAEDHAESLGAGHSAVERPGSSVRCAQYCRCAQWCEYGRTVNRTA